MLKNPLFSPGSVFAVVVVAVVVVVVGVSVVVVADVKYLYRREVNIVKLREREGQRVDSRRSLNGHL